MLFVGAAWWETVRLHRPVRPRMGDEQHLGRLVPADEAGTEAAGLRVVDALLPLAGRRLELLVLDDLAFGQEVRMTGEFDRKVEEPSA